MKTKMRDTILREFERSGHSIKWLSDTSGVPYNAVHRFVRGRAMPLLSTTELFCDALGLELKRKVKRTTKGGK